jgi:hypothetical protein
MPTVNYNLLDDDGFLYATQYLLTKLKPLLVDTNTTYTIDLDTTNQWIVLTASDGTSTHVSYADFGDPNVIESIKVNGSALTPDANKAVNIPLASTSVDGAMSSSDKTKLDNIAAGAQVNVVEGAQIGGTDLTITNKKIQIPAASASSKGVVSNADINTLIQAALAGFERISFQKVNSYSDLPATGANGVIYLVPNSGTAPNIYDEYIWYTDSSTTPATSGYEKIGTTAIDLSGYVQHSDIHLLTNAEIGNIVDDAWDAVFPSN